MLMMAKIRHSRLYLAGMIAALGLAAISGLHVHAWSNDRLTSAAREHAFISVDAVVIAEPTTHKSRFAAMTVINLRAEQFSVRGSTWKSKQGFAVTAPAGQDWSRLSPGSRIRVQGTVSLPHSDSAPRIVLHATQRYTLIDEPGAAPRFLHRVRQGLGETSATLPMPEAALLPGIVIGQTSAIPDVVTQQFRDAALLHVLAVSGANLSILLGFGLLLAGWCGVRGYQRLALAALVTAIFVALCGTEPSVVRASAMGVVALTAVGSGASEGRALRHLCVAILVVLALDPWLAVSWGFALSVAATAGLVLLSGPWAQHLAAWLPRWLAEAIAIPLAAQCATEPVVVLLSGQISIVGVVANVLVAPCIAPATILGFAATALSLGGASLGRIAAVPAGWCCHVIAWVAQHCSQLPGARFSWPAGALPWFVLVGLVLLWLVLARQVLSRWWVCGALVIGMVFTLVHSPRQPGFPPENWSIVVCDVGQGSAAVGWVAAHEAVLFDVGPEPRSVLACLSQLGITAVPVVVLSHDHADHTGGLDAVVTRFHPSLVIVSPTASAQREHLIGLCQDATVVMGYPGLTLHLGDGVLELISVLQHAHQQQPVGGNSGESAAENDGSLVAQWTSASVSTLITGDIEQAAQQEALSRLHPTDVVVVAHHGSGHMLPEFYHETHAQLAVISVGKDNDYGHPAASTLRALRDAGMAVARTDHSGSIAVVREHGELCFVTTKTLKKGTP
ncbi:MAG: ComEC/Rec2 family competence protein, partial [Propionibacteriaceae bacterium]